MLTSNGTLLRFLSMTISVAETCAWGIQFPPDLVRPSPSLLWEAQRPQVVRKIAQDTPSHKVYVILQ